MRSLGVATIGGADLSRYNGTSWVNFTKYNEDGYQFTVPTKRDYYLFWDIDYRVDPVAVSHCSLSLPSST